MVLLQGALSLLLSISLVIGQLDIPADISHAVANCDRFARPASLDNLLHLCKLSRSTQNWLSYRYYACGYFQSSMGSCWTISLSFSYHAYHSRLGHFARYSYLGWPWKRWSGHVRSIRPHFHHRHTGRESDHCRRRQSGRRRLGTTEELREEACYICPI